MAAGGGGWWAHLGFASPMVLIFTNVLQNITAMLAI